MGKNSTQYAVRNVGNGDILPAGSRAGAERIVQQFRREYNKSVPEGFDSWFELVSREVINLDGEVTTTEWEKVE